jgi:phosphatidate cytidylyltransferase
MTAVARTEALLVFAGLGGFLLIASGVTLVLQWRFSKEIPPAVLANLSTRIKAWWVMIAAMAVALWSGPLVVTAVFGIISVAALREFYALIPARSGDSATRWACFGVFLPLQYALVAMQSHDWFGVFIPVAALLALPILATLARETTHFLQRTAEAQWGLMICVYCISHVPAILMLDIPGYAGRNTLLLMFLLLVVQASDVLQYICGKLIGKHPIAPDLSPSKTAEGFVGGVLLATALGGALWWMTPYSPLAATGMAFIITLLGFFGGLVMSAIKRDRGIKDWGAVIQGHGGVLDRLDSVCFSAPVFFHLTRYFYAT